MLRWSLMLALLTLYASDVTHCFLQPQETPTQKAVDEFKALLQKYADDSAAAAGTTCRKVQSSSKRVLKQVQQNKDTMTSMQQNVYSIEGKVDSMQTQFTGLVSQFKVIMDKVLVPADCGEVLERGETQPGVYELKIDGVGRIRAYCSQGFTTFQRRQRGGEDFDRGLSDYAVGFGDPSQDHWLGLNALHAMTREHQCRLRAELTIDLGSGYDVQKTALASYPEDRNGKVKHVEYSTFRVGAGDKFRLTLAGGSTNIQSRYLAESYMLALDNGRDFSTKDRDVDGWSGNCATHSSFPKKGAFWFGVNCGNVYPNSAHNPSGYCSGDNYLCVQWYPYFLRGVQLKLRC